MRQDLAKSDLLAGTLAPPTRNSQDQNENNTFPGPFETTESGKLILKVWTTKETNR